MVTARSLHARQGTPCTMLAEGTADETTQAAAFAVTGRGGGDGDRRPAGAVRRGADRHATGPGDPRARVRTRRRKSVHDRRPHPYPRPRRFGRGPAGRRLSGGAAAARHRLRPAGDHAGGPRRHRSAARRAGRQGARRGGLPAPLRRPLGHPHRRPPGRPLPRCADAAAAAARERREAHRAARPVADSRRDHHRHPALRLPRRDARRLAALLHRRPGQALYRPAGPLQDQHPASASLRRPGLADRHRVLAESDHVRRQHPGRRRPRRLLHQGRLPRDHPPCREPLSDRDPRDRHAGPHQRRARLLRPAELRRRGTAALHRHQGRLQLTVRAQEADVRLRRRRPPRAGGDDPRPLPPHRGRRGALHQP